MKLSKYHIIRFVLDVAYEDHASRSAGRADEEEYWAEWLKGVLRMFGNKHAPLELFQGLIKKENQTLTRLCQAKMALVIQSLENKIEREESWLMRYNAWQERLAEYRGIQCALRALYAMLR